MNLGQMTDAVYRHLQDTERVNATEGDVVDWLNDALVDVDSRLRWTRAEATGTTTSNTVPLPSGLVEVLHLRVGSDTNYVTFASDEDWDGASFNLDSPPVTLARVWGSTIELYPTPSSGSAYTLRYVAEPSPLAGSADTPTLPTSLHRKLVAYAAAQGLYQDGNFALGDRKLAEYEEGLPGPPTGLVKLQPGPYTLQIEPGPFDVPDAAHL